MRTLILAGSFGEAAKYARGKGLRHYRFASSAQAVANFAAQQVVELPGYARRADKHALNAIANRVVRRGGEWIKDEYVPEPDPIDETALGALGRMTREDWLLAGATPAQADDLTPTLTAEQAAEVERVNAVKAAESLENKGSGCDSEKEPKATKRTRRTKEQIAYDEALESWETNGGAQSAVLEARESLAKRHPDDERLTRAHVPGVPGIASDDPFEA